MSLVPAERNRIQLYTLSDEAPIYFGDSSDPGLKVRHLRTPGQN